MKLTAEQAIAIGKILKVLGENEHKGEIKEGSIRIKKAGIFADSISAEYIAHGATYRYEVRETGCLAYDKAQQLRKGKAAEEITGQLRQLK